MWFCDGPHCLGSWHLDPLCVTSTLELLLTLLLGWPSWSCCLYGAHPGFALPPPLSLLMMSVDGLKVWLFWCSSLPLFCHFPRWSTAEDAMGKYGVSFVEILVLFEVWLLRDRGPNTNALVGCWLSLPPSPLTTSPPPPLLPPPPWSRLGLSARYQVACWVVWPLWRVVWPGLRLAAWRSSLQ